MEEFDWSKPSLESQIVDTEKWIDIDDPELTFDHEVDEDADIVLQEYEFDVQPRLLRKKEKKPAEFYVEYNKLTNDILEITPQPKQPSTIKHGIFITKQADLINKIFDGKIPLGKLHIKHNSNKTKEISLSPQNFYRSEFDYVFARHNTDRAPLHIYCDIIMKKLTIDLDYQRLKYYLSMDNLTESKLERNNGHFNIFCIDRKDRTRLYDKININIFELCNIQKIEKKCSWLPDNPVQFNNIGFVYYNNELPITFSTHREIENVRSYSDLERPQIVYKQHGSKLLLQSIMDDTNNFKINEDLILYIFSKYDPTRLLEYKKIKRSLLNNFNLYEIDLSYDIPIRLATDHLHIHLEDSNVSTYYRF